MKFLLLFLLLSCATKVPTTNLKVNKCYFVPRYNANYYVKVLTVYPEYAIFGEFLINKTERFKDYSRGLNNHNTLEIDCKTFEELKSKTEEL